MSSIYTPNVQLAMPASGDRTWNVAVNANCSAVDSLAPVGSLAVVTAEVPSASLNVAVAAGSYIKQDGTVGTYAGTASHAITASTTNYLFLDLTASGSDGQHDRLPGDGPRPTGGRDGRIGVDHRH